MNAYRSGLVLVFVACSTGCATEAATVPSAISTEVRARAVQPQRAKDAIAVGISTKSDVLAALGETRVIHFDTGYEIWLYRLANDVARNAPGVNAELVILFTPSGVVSKTRFRPAPQRL